MCDPPPSKRLRQSNIVEALKKQGSLKENNHQESEKEAQSTCEGPDKKSDISTTDAMFPSEDPSKNSNTSRPHGQKTRTSPRKKPEQGGEANPDRSETPPPLPPKGKRAPTKPASVGLPSRDSSAPDGSSKPSTSAGNQLQSQGSNISSLGDTGDSPSLFDSDIVDFEDDYEIPSSVPTDNTPLSAGTPISELRTYPTDLPPMGDLTSTPHHTVLIKLPYKVGEDTIPHPNTYEDKWDADHVRLPCSPENLYPVERKGGKSLQSRWDLIEKSLLSNMTSSLDIEEAILTYNTRYSHKWDFRGLHSFFTEVIEAEAAAAFFKYTLPKMVNLALQLPQLCTKPIPMLKKTMNHTVTMSHHQAASLLANAFFCTFPRRNTGTKHSEYSTYPHINFSSLFQGGRSTKTNRKGEKLKCIIHYFRRVTSEMPQGTISFRRQSIKDFPKWHQSTAKLTRLHVSATGTIEDDGIGMLQIDFANKYLGGGVLNYGLVQEEIRFMLCPELILSCLFTEVLERNESLAMTGAEMFSRYTGYSDSFQWNGDFQDTTPRDPWGRRCTTFVAIDAIVVRTHVDQFQRNLVRRELDKAYCGFLSPGVGPQHLAAVATGNWGCGAFGGDVQLKALLQLLAAAEAQRDVAYFTFHNFDLMTELDKMHQFIVSKHLSVSDVFHLIEQYYDNICVRNTRRDKPKTNLYDYIYRVYSDMGADTDSTDQDEDNGEVILGGKTWKTAAHSNAAAQDSPDYAADTP